MFVTKHPWLRRTTSLLTAVLLFLAFTPGIAVIAVDSASLQITSPAENDFVKNPVSLGGTATIPNELGWHIGIVWDWTSDDQVTQPDDVIDITPVPPNDPYTYNWSKNHDYPIEKDGIRTIKVWLYKGAFDLSGTSVTRQIIVDNTLPEVTSLTPQDNAVVSNKDGNVKITATANDDNGIFQVDFFLDDNDNIADGYIWTKYWPGGGIVFDVADNNYTFSWDTLGVEYVGTYYLTAWANDNAGNIGSVTHKVFVTRYDKATVGSAGFEGDLSILGAPVEKVHLKVPQGALSESKDLTVEVYPLLAEPPTGYPVPKPPDGYSALPRAYIFGPSPLNFSKPVEITFNYSDEEIPEPKDVNEGKLGVYYYDSAKGWVFQSPKAQDKDKNTITIETSHFSTYGLFVDTVPPTVTAVSPADGATGVSASTKVTATFSEDMDKTTITASNFTLTTDSASVGGTVTYDEATRIATFTPSAKLAYKTKYKARILTGVKDLFGNALAQEKVWEFETAAQPPSAPTGLTATPGDGVINLTWNTVTGATGYYVYYGTSPGSYGSPIKVEGGNQTSYQLKNLTNGVKYYIALTAYNADGESDKSTEISATPTGSYGLTLAKTVDKTSASPNDTLTYTITYTNTGQSALTDVQLTDQIPDGTDYVVDSVSTGGTYNPSTFTLTWDIGNLAAGSSGTASFKVKIASSAVGTIVNTASIKSAEITSSKTASASTTLPTTVAATGTTPGAEGAPAGTAAAQAAAGANPAKKLPRTGMELTWYLLLAGLLILSGTGLQFVGRREES